MKIENLFERDIFRPINGVVKADQLDDSSVWQELDEFVITKELDEHFRKFVAWFLESADRSNKAAAGGKMGIWISGFFGSGKSHFLKVLSYLLRNRPHANEGKTRHAVEFFEDKVKDALLFADIKRAVIHQTDVVLFNIDSKADHRTGRDLILRVFLKVLNELQGYSGDHAHIAHLERYLAAKGILAKFHEAYRKHTGLEWLKERDAYQFNRDEVVKALAETLGQSQTAAEKWIDGAEDNFSLTVENFCKWVKEYLDSKGPDHRLVFLVDEVGQFIGTDSHLMLNLQTITEELGTICQRRAWVIVTSQEDMDTVLGDMTKAKRQDFSKIQGRFFPPLSLSSANVDEVIQTRLLAKHPEVNAELEEVFRQKGDILKNQLTFTNSGMTFRKITSAEDFAKNYPFVPYQFQLLQKIFETIRKAGATGLHLARGERSMLDAFQSAAKAASAREVGVLVPLFEFYPSIESFLDTSVKKTIDQAKSNPSLDPADVKLLQVLFLIRYVEEMKGNVDNLVTLCLDQIDGDRLSLRRSIEASLARLEKETLISRNGDTYFFLTNEERDINKEIKGVELSSGDEAELLGAIIFDEVLKEKRKHRFAGNKMDFDFNRRCDALPVGNQKDGALLVHVLTPLGDDYDLYDKAKCILDSTQDGGHVLVRLENDEGLGRELRMCVQTTKYLKRKADRTLPESTQRILRDCAEGNRQRRERLTVLLDRMLAEAAYFAAGQPLKLKATNAEAMIDEALEYVIQNTFTKMSYLKLLTPEGERLKEIQAVLRSNDVGKEQLLFDKGEANPEALQDIRAYLELATKASRQVVLHDMIEKRYAVRPYGWPDEEVLLLLARLLVLGDVSVMMDGVLLPIDKVYEAFTTPAKRRKVVLVKRHTPDPDALRKARVLGKDLFAETGPDGADGLCAFLQDKLKDWQTSLNSYKPMAATGDYPGAETISNGLALTGRLLAAKDCLKFVDQFNESKEPLLEFAEHYHEIEHFYEHQLPIWEKLRKANERFQLNRRELERNVQAQAAMARMTEILAEASPYRRMKDVEALIQTVTAVNTTLVAERRTKAIAKVDQSLAVLRQDIASVEGDDALRDACLNPLELLRQRIESEESVAHITQAEGEVVAEHDAGTARIEAFATKQIETWVDPSGTPTPAPQPVVVKKQRVVVPSKIVKTAYLETPEQVEAFLEDLRIELEAAIAKHERIQIR